MKSMKWENLSALCILVILYPSSISAGRGGGRRGKGKGKNLLPFGNVAEYTLLSDTQSHPNGARITKGSFYSQSYRPGFKILLICQTKGLPMPDIKWYKDGSELRPRRNIHVFSRRPDNMTLWNKIEIDPAVLGDQGIYTCMANNKYGLMVKNFKCECNY